MRLLCFERRLAGRRCSVSSLCRDVAARLGEAHLSAIPLEPIANPGLGAEAHSLDNAMPYAQGSSASTAGKGFCEISSSNGALGRFPGRELMGIVKEYMHSYIP